MADDSFTKGYESSTPESATTPNMPDDDRYRAPGAAAKEMKARWRGLPERAHDEGPVK